MTQSSSASYSYPLAATAMASMPAPTSPLLAAARPTAMPSRNTSLWVAPSRMWIRLSGWPDGTGVALCWCKSGWFVWVGTIFTQIVGCQNWPQGWCVPPIAYHLCLNLPWKLSQPQDYFELWSPSLYRMTALKVIIWARLPEIWPHGRIFTFHSVTQY